jgi:hypothetical protein
VSVVSPEAFARRFPVLLSFDVRDVVEKRRDASSSVLLAFQFFWLFYRLS